MIDNVVVRARTALSPEWDRGFDEAFAELVSNDPDLVQAEFDDLIAASWPDASGPAPPSDPTARSAPPPRSPGRPPPAPRPDETSGHDPDRPQSPP
ncbi:hypothetical protein Aab01nite_84510 [Paractinoplanes abujensis]|uniref:Uncharacterized protein n=1 Tax=Paractinoplanes abujensis TaxID=882441 RepID=A0A7W7CQW1_9ACTN|nr:hypothetical protein [Actinoplanes abujensis]MBB4693074.1 hypothetical protein [Actinoplanes abujensis]GID24861.1 hypothetical protein Aab01nite_84510 [Actinoplanes abujensis]